MKNKLSHSFDIQFFAGRDIDGKGSSGVKAPDAGEQIPGVKISPDAGDNTQAQRAERFEALIRGEYKDMYDQRVQSILTKRLKGSEETVKRYKALSPVLRLLEKKYGVARDDAEALARALTEEESRRAVRNEQLARRQYEKWLEEAGKTRESYPDFDLSRELSDSRFKTLIRSGVPMSDAYELIHRRELVEKTARDMEERISRRILSGDSRPRESGIGGQSSALVKTDMSRMSKKARQDIIRRVQRGERISF